MRISRFIQNARVSLRRHLPFLRDLPLLGRPRHWYDMVADVGEQYYLEQYWHWMSGYLPKSGSHLDIGCGYGRVTLALGQACSPKGEVLGIDISSPKIEQARRYAADRKLSNVRFQTADLLPFLRACPRASYDTVVFLEVAFFYPEFVAAIEEIRGALKPQGLLFASFRPQYFNILHSVQHEYWDDAGKALRDRQGHLWGSEKCLTWQTSSEIKEMITVQGFEILKLVGIGCCSGSLADPLLHVADPKKLGPGARQKLLSLETALGESLPDCGRYILVIAKKNSAI